MNSFRGFSHNQFVKEGSTVPRKGHIAKRDVLADPLYNDKVVQKTCKGHTIFGSTKRN